MGNRTYSGIPGAYGFPGYGSGNYIQSQIRRAGESARGARDFTDVIEEYSPEGVGGFIAPTVQTALELGMMGGQTGAEYEASRNRVTGGFNRALGNLSSATAGRGYYSPESAASAGAGKPAAALAQGLTGLEAERGRTLRESRAEVGRTAAGLFQYPAREAEARQSAYGQAFGRFQTRPRWGIGVGPVFGPRGVGGRSRNS